MRYRIRRHPAPLPAPSHRPTASRRTVSPDGSNRSPTPSYPLFARCPPRLLTFSPHLIGSSVSPVAYLPRQTHAVAIRLPPHAAHPSHSTRPISSAHLPSRSASRCTSRRASRLVSSRLTACHASSFALLHLIGLSSVSLLAHPRPSRLSHPSHRFIGHRPATSDETSGEQAKRRTGWRKQRRENGTPRHQIPPGYRKHPSTSSAYSPYEPHNAQTSTRTRPRKNDPSTSITTPQMGNTGRRTR